jgi:DUF917 family protein
VTGGKEKDLKHKERWSKNKAMRLIDEEDVEEIALGAAVLGTGGGGDPYIGKLMAIDAIREFGKVKLLDLSEVKDDDLIIPTAMMGAPTVIVEKIPNGNEIEKAYRRLEKILGMKSSATMPTEAGGLNSTIPFTLAASLQIPVIDADGMGRAFPEVQMETFGLFGVKATPMTMSDEKGNEVTIDANSDLSTERLSRAITVVMGGSASISVYSMTGKQLKKSAIPNTITLAQKIGRSIREQRTKGRSAIEAILSQSNGRIIFKGKIVDVNRRTTGGFARGNADFDGMEEYTGKHMVVHFQNENLVAEVDGRTVASVPDLITVLDLETGLPITTESLRFGFRVAVVGIPCSEKWRTKEALEVVGPKYFGYDTPYIPIEAHG